MLLSLLNTQQINHERNSACLRQYFTDLQLINQIPGCFISISSPVREESPPFCAPKIRWQPTKILPDLEMVAVFRIRCTCTLQVNATAAFFPDE